MEVRAATPADAQSIAPLLAELGYPTGSEAVAARIQRLTRSEQTGVLVADEAGTAIALLAFQFIELLERPQPTCRITALVTGAAHRRRGAASELLAALRSLAEERDCERLEVTTKPDRDEALAFYRAHGFHERPRRLVRYLDS